VATGCCSVLVFVRLELHIAYAPSAVTRTPLQSFHLPQKLHGKCRLALETLVIEVAPQA
jgi:hypothetical protein